MDRGAGRVSNTLSDEPIAERRNVRAAHAGVVGSQECVGKIHQPVRVGVSIVVDVGNDFARGGLQTEIAGSAKATILGANEPETVLMCNRRCLIS